VGTAPVAAFTGTPVSGTYPLAVSFVDQSANAPTSWSWTFGDGGTSTAQSPAHTYTVAGTFTVSLTAANAYGSDVETKTGYITVTAPSTGGTMHVADIVVTRILSGRKYIGQCAVTIADVNGAPVSGASVTVLYTGTNTGTLTGVTGTTGVVNFVTVKSTATVPFCFEVTNVTHASLTYAPGDNLVTKSCEGGDVFNADSGRLAGVQLLDASPNPFNPRTTIAFSLPAATDIRLTVYDARGRQVAVLADGSFAAGLHEIMFDGTDQPSGVYFYRLQADGAEQTAKMIMLK
jgi:PKD repeat protein